MDVRKLIEHLGNALQANGGADTAVVCQDIESDQFLDVDEVRLDDSASSRGSLVIVLSLMPAETTRTDGQ
jgi:hypothetical protein